MLDDGLVLGCPLCTDLRCNHVTTEERCEDMVGSRGTYNPGSLVFLLSLASSGGVASWFGWVGSSCILTISGEIAA